MLERMPGAQADLVLPHIQELRRLNLYVFDEDRLGPQGVFAHDKQRPLACRLITGLKLPTAPAPMRMQAYSALRSWNVWNVLVSKSLAL
jgi:hypothetical protein